MTFRSLSTPNSALRVFSASLLSALLIMMPFVQLAAAEKRSEVRAPGSESGRQAAEGSRQDTAKSASAENVFLNAPVPKPAPEPPALAPVIVATKDDGLATATTVAPGGTINYSVNVKNNGTLPADDATSVVFTDIIDAHTTLVVGSAVAAVSDRYNAIGNVQLSIPDGATDLLGNDFDPDTGNNIGMTATPETKSSTQCTGGCSNNVTINLDGSFTYDPPVGFAGTDTFTYTAHSTVGPGVATETVTISVANEIWFINNNVGACPSAPCDGRLSHPFTTLAAFTAANLGGVGQPGDSDWIFIYESATDYVGPATLRNGQKFIGQDATASLAALTGFPPASGTDQLPGMNTGAPAVTITTSVAATNGINLLSNNTLRGFTVGNTTAADIAGTSFGTLTAADINLNGTGRPLNLTTGNLAATFGTLTSTSSSGGAGINLSGVGGTLTVTGAVSITGASTQGISISGSTLNATFGSTTVASSTAQGILIGTHTIGTLAFGNTNITGGTIGVSLQNNASGSRTFGTLDISGGANEAFLHGAGGGNVTAGATTLSSPGSAISVTLPLGSPNILSFGATSATTTTAGVTAVSWSGIAGASMTFNSLGITRNNAIALGVGGGGTVNVTNGTGTITATTAAGPAIVASGVQLNANFSAINSSGGANGVNLNNVTGTSNFGTGQLTGTGSGATFQVTSGTATVTYSGNITQGAAALMVSIIDHTSGTITFQTGTLSATLGTGIAFDNADGIYNFSSGTGATTLNGSNAHIDIIDSTGGTITFGANTTISNPSGVAVNVDGTANAITAGISIAGSISKTSGGRLIDFFNYDTGTANITATLSCTSSCGGIEVTNNALGTSGTVNFSGATKTLNTSGSNAVQLDNNDGGSVNFTGGGLDIDTTTGLGFNAINGGTVTVTGSGNSINSVSAAALTVTSTDIGAADLIFQRIDSGNNTAAADPTNGIVLTNTGSSGNLTVTGNSAGQCGGAVNSGTAPFTITAPATADCTGGEIQSTTGSGIVLTNTRDVSLTRMWIHNTVLSGIDGTTVTNFTFDRGLIEKSGLDNALGAVTAVADVSNIAFNDISGGVTNITGTVTITRSTLRHAFYHGVSIYNENGTIADLVIGGSSAGNAINSTTSTATSKGSGIKVIENGAAASAGVITKATVGHNSILNFPSDSGMKILGGNAAFGPQSTMGIPGSATDIFTITNNEVKGPNSATPMGSNGIETAMTGTGRAKFSITNNGTATNPIQHFLGIGITCSGGNRSQLVCLINNNFIDGGDNIFSSRGMAVGAQVGYPGDTTSNGTVNISVTNNTVNNSAGQGIFGAITNSNISGNILIQNNTVGSIRDASTPAIRVESGSSSGDTNLCLNLSSNTATGNAAPGIGVRKQGVVATTNDFGIVGLAPSPANANQTEDYIGTQNPGSNLGPVGFSNDGLRSVRAIVHSGSNYVVCTQPAIAAMQKETQDFLASVRDESSTENTLRTGNTNSLLSFLDTKDSVGSIIENLNRGSLVSVSPSSAEIKPLVAHTVASRNESSDNVASLQMIGSAASSLTRLASISVLHTENPKDEIRTHHAPSSKLETRNTRDEGTGLRAHYATLSKLATRSATAAPAPMSGETVTANIGTLPAGGSATITFQVTVNNPPNLTLLSPPRVENQGTVTATGGINVLTDDPNVVGAADKTATRIDLFDTTTSLVSDINPSNDGDTVTFTATINETPVQGSVNPTGTVDFIDTSNGNAVICNDVTVTASSAQCAVSNLSAGSTHNIRADYSGDGNFDPSQSNLVAQVVNACVINPVVTNTADSGAGSLRDALATVCSAPNNNITFNIPIADPGFSGGVYTITLATQLVVGKTMNITGPNSITNTNPIVVSGNNVTRVLSVNAAKSATITGLTLTNGLATGASFPDTHGGAIFNSGTLTLINSTVKGSVAKGGAGGIYTGAGTTLNITRSTISGNSTQDASTGGGGIAVDSATATLINSTISGNSTGTGGQGGGIHNSAGTMTITNCTIAENSIAGGGGSSGGINTEGVGATVNIGNTIVANNVAGVDPDVKGTFNSQDYNLIENVGSATIGGATANNITAQDPGIDSLANNGGPTFTHRIISNGSPVMDKGNTALTTDQRGQPRPKDNLSVPNASGGDGDDIGAYEAPLPPQAPDLDAASDTGASSTDDYTSDNTPTFTIQGVENGAFVELLAGATVVGSGTAVGTTIQLTSTMLADGPYSFTARQTVGGGLSPTSTGLNVTIDTGAPGAPTIDLVAASDSGVSNTDDITNAATRTFDIGNTETGATVELLRDGNPVGGTITGNGGTVQLSDSTAAVSGTTYAYTARQTDSGGNQATSGAVNVTFDNVGPTVSMSSVASNPTNTSPIPVTVLFNESVNGFDATDIVPGNAAVNNFAGSGANYTFDLVPSGQGTVTADISAAVAQDTAGNDNSAATQFSRTFDTDAPTANITDVTPDPRNNSVSSITIVFSEAVTGFNLADLTLTLDGGANLLTGAQTLSSGDGGITWTLGNLGGITGTQGTYLLTLTAAGSGITDNASNALAGDATDSWVVDTSAPTVTINQAAGQVDPTSSSPINFTVVFNEPVTGFTSADVTFSGAGATTVVVTEVAPNDGTTYNVAISGMNADGTVQASVNVNAAQDAVGNNSAASTSTDNTVQFINAITINVQDAKVPEPASPNTIDMTFTVSLSTPAPVGGVNVNFTTNDGTATSGTCGTPGADYVLTSGTVNFPVGQQVRTINVPVCSDTAAEGDETFTVTLSSPTAPGVIGDGTATGTITGNTPGTFLISELRTSGPGGAGDDFVEVYNNSNAPVTVAASDISAGYGLYKMGADCNATPVLIGVIPNGTVIPARGHYLFVGSAYSLANYGGTGAAAGNLTFSSDIETDANVGLFTTSNVTSISSVNRLDAVGFGANVGGACNLLREATTLPPIAGNATLEHSYFRKMCEWIQGSGCTVPGIPKDTNINADDFWLADTAGSAITGRLGAPGPENLASPIRRDTTGINVVVLDGTVGASAGANRDRNGSAVPNGTFGTMTLRYRVTNNTGGDVTRLRYRIVDISTAIQPAGPTADLRALTGSIESSPADFPQVHDSVTCAAANGGNPATPCNVTVQATTLEQPPTQTIGGGYNSTLSSGTITTGTPLPNNQSILINFKLGVQKTGTFRFYIVVEALP